jgi:hypothetical protein
MRVMIHRILVDFSKSYKICKVKGVYPPKLNISEDQSDMQLLEELRKMINYMKNPQYSYLTKY